MKEGKDVSSSGAVHFRNIFSRYNWRVIDTGVNDLYMNMAIDESLAMAGEAAGLPVLRFYDWSSLSLSIGYGQRINRVIDMELCAQENMPVVRRPTGGGVVFHGIDITYSVILQPGMVSDIYEAYREVQSCIQRAFKQMGIFIELYKDIARHDLSSFCFVTPNFGDLMIGKRKLGGMAARRMGQKILCQGYIYSDNAALFTRFCRIENSLAKKAISLRMMGLDRKAAIDKVTAAWPGGTVTSSLNDAEAATALNLYEDKYNRDEWNYRR